MSVFPGTVQINCKALVFVWQLCWVDFQLLDEWLDFLLQHGRISDVLAVALGLLCKRLDDEANIVISAADQWISSLQNEKVAEAYHNNKAILEIQ